MQILRNYCLFLEAGAGLEFALFIPKVKQFSASKFSTVSFETNGTRCQIWME